jgi:hypothetical protein
MFATASREDAEAPIAITPAQSKPESRTVRANDGMADRFSCLVPVLTHAQCRKVAKLYQVVNFPGAPTPFPDVRTLRYDAR